MKARSTKILFLAAVLLLSAGCGALNSSATTPPPTPEVTAAKSKTPVPAAERYEGYALHVKPAAGPELILKEPSAAQLVLDASCTPRLRVPDAVGVFGNRVDVLDETGRQRFSFTVSSDGKQLMKASDGTIFRMPEYVYYLIEQDLWAYGGTLMSQPLSWQPATGAAQPKLELDLPRLINAAMLSAFGYAEAYFCSYKIYSVDTASARNTAKVYALVTVAGYSFKGTVFFPVFRYTAPMAFTFIDSGGYKWRLTALKQPPWKNDKTFYSYSNVRLVFPFEAMQDVMTDLKDTSIQTKDIAQQADEYLNSVGLAGLTVES